MSANGTTHPFGSGPACVPCAAALTNPYAGEYRAGCVACEVRHVSQRPAEGRAAFYASLTSDEERVAFQTAVSMEYRRRKALLAERPVQ